ncbi:GNAT family [Colletotrichum truncatum]|uniref:GNAT family n=1 Tax=Colletotrichum truncatum TaxID=5467 RepID=A0ACC3ZBK6_COLTU|nr:GNAT family [Colletotrichum truncatum]KAF6787814.1 GNAT family [Colletotrichum truncatum]
MHVRAITRADIPNVTDVSDAAFINAELNVWLYPHRQEYPECWRSRINRMLHSSLVKPGVYGFVCVTDDEDPADWPRDQIIGYSWWEYNGPADDPLSSKWRQNNSGISNAVERTLMDWHSRYVNFFQLDKSVSRERQAAFYREGAERGNPFAPLKSFWNLIVLGVHPDWQGRGAGKKLMRWGLDRSAEDKVPIILIASTPGQRMYTRMGFDIVDWATTESLSSAEGGAIMILDTNRKYTREATPEESERDFFGMRRKIDAVYI